MLMNVVEIGPFGWLHLIFFGVYIPVLVLRSQRQLASGRPIPWVRRYFLSGAVAQLLFLLISLGVARLERIELAPRQLPRPAGVVAGAVMLAVLIAFMRARWRRNVERGLPIVRMFMPRDRVERAQWTTPSALAGVGEEITWRGVQFVLVWRLVGTRSSRPQFALRCSPSFTPCRAGGRRPFSWPLPAAATSSSGSVDRCTP
jgi:hypothetical protein